RHGGPPGCCTPRGAPCDITARWLCASTGVQLAQQVERSPAARLRRVEGADQRLEDPLDPALVRWRLRQQSEAAEGFGVAQAVPAEEGGRKGPGVRLVTAEDAVVGGERGPDRLPQYVLPWSYSDWTWLSVRPAQPLIGPTIFAVFG